MGESINLHALQRCSRGLWGLMDYSHPSLLSALDLSTDSTSHNATVTSLCPRCSRPHLSSKIADALKQAQERAAHAEQQLQKSKSSAILQKKWLDRAKENNVKLFLENQKMTKEIVDLHDRIKQMEAKIKQLEELLAVTKRQLFKQQSKQKQESVRDKTPQHSSKTPQKTPISYSKPLKDQYFFISKDRSAYIGQIMNGMPHGHGRLFIKVAQFYQGEFKMHRIDGFGVMRNLVTNQYYKGQWRNGKRHGKGLKILGSIRYEGEFRDDIAEGLGEGTDLKTGKKYIGQWKNNKFQQRVADSMAFYC